MVTAGIRVLLSRVCPMTRNLFSLFGVSLARTHVMSVSWKHFSVRRAYCSACTKVVTDTLEEDKKSLVMVSEAYESEHE